MKSFDLEHQADIYALYSLVMQKPELSHLDSSQTYLIEDTTGKFYGEIDLRTCIQVGPEHRAAFEETLAEYEAHRTDRVPIQPRFRAGKSYKLIDKAEAGALVKALSQRPNSDQELKTRFAGGTDVIRLSNVYFDRSHTFAVFSVSAYCGPLCGRQTVYFYRKNSDGIWSPVKLAPPICPGIIS